MAQSVTRENAYSERGSHRQAALKPWTNPRLAACRLFVALL